MRRPSTWVAERDSCHAIIRSERRITVVGADMDDTIMEGLADMPPENCNVSEPSKIWRSEHLYQKCCKKELGWTKY